MIRINTNKKVIENLPPHIFSNLGINQIAYIKNVTIDGEACFTVYAADGQEISQFDEFADAEEFIKYSNLMPITVH